MWIKLKIWVRSVTFEGFTTKGALNLNSEWSSPDGTTPTWLDLAGSSRLDINAVTVYDGRRDGKEGLSTAEAKSETPKTLNPVIVQSKEYDNGEAAGVTNTAVNLFNGGKTDNSDLEDPVLVIPTGEEMKITIVYDVETIDNNLSGKLSDGKTHGSTIENAIEQTITLSDGKAMKLVSGKKFTVRLHLGMTSVKFDAEVTDWDTGDEADVDLPYNKMLTWAGNTTENVSIPNTAGTYTIGIDGLKGKTIQSVYSSGSNITSTSYKLVGDRLTVTYTTAENTAYTNNTEGKVYVQVDGKTMNFVITQAHKPLELSLTLSGKTITPTASGVTSWSGATATIVKTNGTTKVDLEPTTITNPTGNYFFFRVQQIGHPIAETK